MSRRRKERSKRTWADPKFGDLLVGKFVNTMMWSGKKSVATRSLYKALDLIGSRTSDTQPIEVFHNAMENVRPMVEVRSRRVGGATYQIPTEVRPERRDTLAIRWLIAASRARGEKTMSERLANELMDASQNRGTAVKKKEDAHKMAEANRAFAHYRW